jgi:PGF-CTERM protein
MTAVGANRRSRPWIVALACCLAVGLLVPAPTLAGDGTTVFSLDPTELDAEPGEEIEISIVVSAHGDLHGNGIDAAGATVAYDSAVFEAIDVEDGTMLEDGDDVELDASTAVDEEAGTVTIEQERTPSGDGATGNEPIATITFAVAEDAEPTSETIELADASAMLVGDYPQATFERDATVHVDGGDDEEAAEDSDADDTDAEGVTLADDEDGDGDEPSEAENDSGAADDTDGTDDADDASNGSDTDDAGDADDADADSVPGFAVPAAVAALALALWLARRRL